MSTPQVLPTRTFIVKVCVPALIGPDSTSNASIWVRAGGARSAIGAVFKLLLVGQPFGPGANVAAIPAAATATSVSEATAAMTLRLVLPARRDRRSQGTCSMTSSSVVGSPPCAFRRSGTNAFPEARRALHALGLSSFLAGGPRRGSLVIEIRMDLDR